MEKFWSILGLLFFVIFVHVSAQVSWRATDDSPDKYSYYNQSCLHENHPEGAPDTYDEHGYVLKPCNPVKLFTCANETHHCVCQPELEYDDVKDSCFPPVPAQEEDDKARFEPKAIIETCRSDRECWQSAYGRLSRCIVGFGGTGKCECYDTQTAGLKEVVQIDGNCHFLKRRGDECQTDAECNATIVGNAVCTKLSINLDSSFGTCDCDGKSFWDNRLQECLQYADGHTGLRFTCKSDNQCSHPVALGRLAKCDEMSRKCVCFDVDTNGRMPTGYYSGKCFLKLRANETCQNDIECRLGSGEDSACVDNPEDYNNSNKHCKCHATHVWGETHEENEERCLVIGKLNSRCTSDNQCQHQNGLGELSQCAKFSNSNNPKEGQCVCWDPVEQKLDTTGFSNGYCYYKRKESERCESTEECIVGWSPNAVCHAHESYNGETVCQCPEGTVCKSGANAANSAAAAAVVMASIFALLSVPKLSF